MSKADVQFRGHCQCCGNQQAVTSGHMSKHGYTVDHGWFNGVCSGNRYAPIEADRTISDKIISDITQAIAEHNVTIANLKSGAYTPATCRNGKFTWVKNVKGRNEQVFEMVPFKEAPQYQQVCSIESLIFHHERRISAGEQFIDFLSGVVTTYHGKALIEVAKKEATVYIKSGEKRKNEKGMVLTAKYQDGARVHYEFTRDSGKVLTTWMGSRAWRSLELVTE